jgi:hypothetical protein
METDVADVEGQERQALARHAFPDCASGDGGGGGAAVATLQMNEPAV